MNNILHILMIISISFFIGCSSANEKENIMNHVEPDVPEFENLHSFLDRNNTSIHVLINYGKDLEHDLITDILIEYSNLGFGLELFMDYCFNRRLGDIDVDNATIFAQSMLNGAWSERYNQIISQGLNIPNLSRTIVFIYRSIENDDFHLAQQTIDHYFEQTENIKESILRSMANITMASLLYLEGFDEMDQIVKSNSDIFNREISISLQGVRSASILSLISSIAVVDSERAWKIVNQAIDDNFIRVEAKAAIAGGMMFTDYNNALTLFKEALQEINRFHIPNVSSTHTTFENAFNNLNVDDQKILINDYFHAMIIFGRLPIVPIQKRPYLLAQEPELPAWYRDSMFKWLSENYVTTTRLDLLYKALLDHCGRFPRSAHTDIFVGWALEWTRQNIDPYDKYVSIGKLLMVPNAAIPDNVNIAKPRIIEIIRSFDSNLPVLLFQDSILQIAISEIPDQFITHLENITPESNEINALPLMFNMLRIRHFIYPDKHADLPDLITELAEKWILPDNYNDFDFYADLASIWAGYDDEKAWEMVNRMDSSSGEYPKALVTIAEKTIPYSPGFASRCLDDLKTRYTNWEYKLSNPNLESSLVQSLTRISIIWADEFAQIIVNHRGNEFPTYSFYNHTKDILRESIRYRLNIRDLQKISANLQDELTDDLFRLTTDKEIN